MCDTLQSSGLGDVPETFSNWVEDTMNESGPWLVRTQGQHCCLFRLSIPSCSRYNRCREYLTEQDPVDIWADSIRTQSCRY